MPQALTDWLPLLNLLLLPALRTLGQISAQLARLETMQGEHSRRLERLETSTHHQKG